MYISLLIYDKVGLKLFHIFYDKQYQRGKSPPSSLVLLLFGIILNAEDKNNEYHN